MRLFCCFCLITLLGGCASRPLPDFLTPRDQQLFVQGMDAMANGGDFSATFDTLQKNWPESPWSHRAQKITDLHGTIENQQKTIDRLSRDKTVLRRENKDLQQKLQTLESDREKLRRLLIDLERRGR